MRLQQICINISCVSERLESSLISENLEAKTRFVRIVFGVPSIINFFYDSPFFRSFCDAVDALFYTSAFKTHKYIVKEKREENIEAEAQKLLDGF